MLVGFTILSSTFLLTPSAHDVTSSFNDTAELQRHLASMEYPLPEGHSLVINAETSVGACGSDLWHKIRDRWRARRAERETKTHQTAAWRNEGRRDDGGHELGAEGIWQGRQQEHGREAAQRRVEDALRTCSASVGSQRRSLHALDDKARGARVQETEREIARPLRTGGDQGQGSRPRSSRDSGFHGPLASPLYLQNREDYESSRMPIATGKPTALSQEREEQVQKVLKLILGKA